MNSITDDDTNTLQIFHININCSDFERALEFYQLIGFRPMLDFDADSDTRTFGERGIGAVLNLPENAAGRAMLLTLGDNPRATRLDLIEWQQPRSQAHVRGDLTRLGLARICLKVKDCEKVYRRLLEHGFNSYTPPTRIELGGSYQIVFCCEDPDGTVIEFMEFVR
ncbi:MAG TPA: VOC family protein [Spongiibacteraceae bacterium]|nr:VOC family protein [Spongiibacteraceae bacterium]